MGIFNSSVNKLYMASTYGEITPYWYGDYSNHDESLYIRQERERVNRIRNSAANLEKARKSFLASRDGSRISRWDGRHG